MSSKKTIALFGGSFNPIHTAHLEMGINIYNSVPNIDEVWFLFSVNHQKNSKDYESIEHRMAMGELILKEYAEYPFRLSDIQEHLGTHITHEVLEKLKTEFPDHQFIWTMGADSLVNFHTWENWEEIIENYPILLLQRPGYNELAKNSIAAKTYPHLMKDTPCDLCGDKHNGWFFLDNPEIEMSSSNVKSQLKKGKAIFSKTFQPVADYIIEHGLYEVSNNTIKPDMSNDLDLGYE